MRYNHLLFLVLIDFEWISFHITNTRTTFILQLCPAYSSKTFNCIWNIYIARACQTLQYLFCCFSSHSYGASQLQGNDCKVLKWPSFYTFLLIDMYIKTFYHYITCVSQILADIYDFTDYQFSFVSQKNHTGSLSHQISRVNDNLLFSKIFLGLQWKSCG